MVQSSLQRLQRAVRTGAYRLTEHAEDEREEEAISVSEIEEAFGSDALELLEDYPDDPRGPSMLFLGYTRAGNPLHAVVGVSSPDVIVFVTLCRPARELWYDWRRRVRRS